MKRKSKRLRILAAAEEIMSQKGLEDSTISEISTRAGVTDSLIYQYFTGKEDLLYSIPGVRMEEVLNLLDEQLQGIPNAASQLGKMIWFHLRYNDTHLEYARILFLECRFSKEFYATPAYQLVRKYAGILSGILQKGIEDRLFRNDVDLRLMRDIIIGTLTYEIVTCLTLNEIEESVKDFEAIMCLIHAMLFRAKEDAPKKIKKSDKILNAAEKIFAEKGFSKTKISEIAKLSGVASGTVYEYFTNKEALLLSIPVKRLEHYLNQLQELFIIKSPFRKLRRMIKYHFSFFLTEREFLKVFLLQIQLNKEFYTSEAFKMYSKYFKVIEDVIEEGISEGVFNKKINPRVYRNMLLGTFNQVALRWLMLGESNEFDKMREIDHITNLLSSAVLPQDFQEF